MRKATFLCGFVSLLSCQLMRVELPIARYLEKVSTIYYFLIFDPEDGL
jgi:hypothetical protein